MKLADPRSMIALGVVKQVAVPALDQDLLAAVQQLPGGVPASPEHSSLLSILQADIAPQCLLRCPSDGLYMEAIREAWRGAWHHSLCQEAAATQRLSKVRQRELPTQSATWTRLHGCGARAGLARSPKAQHEGCKGPSYTAPTSLGPHSARRSARQVQQAEHGEHDAQGSSALVVKLA